MIFSLLFCILEIFVLHCCDAYNETCNYDSDCDTSDKTVCSSGYCICSSLHYYSKDQYKCLEFAKEFEAICFEDAQCEFLGNNSACLSNICRCRSGYSWFQARCQQFSTKGQFCNETLTCLDPNTPLALKCGSSNTCECSAGYYDRGNDCRLQSEVDGECAIDKDCFPTNKSIYSHCELGKCVKESALVSLTASLGNYSNVLSSGLSSADYYSADCPNGIMTNLTENECSDCGGLYFHESCICKPGYFLVGTECIPELGMNSSSVHYTSSLDCPIKPGKLVDGVCYCKDYWFQDISNKKCIKTTLQYTKNCMDNGWCKSMGDYAYCDNQTSECRCLEQSTFNETTFYCNLNDDADLSGICLKDLDCSLYESCKNGKCTCSDGFFKMDEDGLCLPKIGESCEVRNCSHIENAYCNEASIMCECPDDYVTNGLLCLKAAEQIYDECEIEEQCEKIKYTSCQDANMDNSTNTNITSQCLCSEEYLDVNGSCYLKRNPGSLCSTSTDCTVILGDTFVCRNMLCQCPTGWSLKNSRCSSRSPNTTHISSKLAILLLSFLSFLFL